MLTCPAHDFFDGQEKIFILQSRDQCEFFFDLCTHVPRNSARPTHGRARVGQLAQPGIGITIHFLRNQFMWVFVLEHLHAELALRCDAQRLGKQISRIDSGEILHSAQMALAVRE